MSNYQEQLERLLDVLEYAFNHKQDIDIIILTVEHFRNQGMPIDDVSFRLFDRDFVKTGAINLKIFWTDVYVDE